MFLYVHFYTNKIIIETSKRGNAGHGESTINNVTIIMIFLIVNQLTPLKISFYFILSSEINVYQKWIKVIFSLQN